MEVDVGTPIAIEEVDESAGTVSADADMEFSGVKYKTEIAVRSERKRNFFIRDDHSHVQGKQRALSMFSNGLLLIA